MEQDSDGRRRLQCTVSWFGHNPCLKVCSGNKWTRVAAAAGRYKNETDSPRMTKVTRGSRKCMLVGDGMDAIIVGSIH